MNIWKQFQALLPSDPLLIATIAAHNSDGTSTLVWPGGGQSVVRGQSVAVGQKAYVKSGQVQGEAPDLTVYEFEV
jgi:hypothetical protein